MQRTPRPTPTAPLPAPRLKLVAHRSSLGGHEKLWRALMTSHVSEEAHTQAAAFIDESLASVQNAPCELPESPDDLHAWMERSTQENFARYEAYLAERKAGGARRFFRNRAHALYFLRMVTPTKLVDGSWLWGLVRHANNPRLSALVRTYVEELGEGDPAKNHVLLYRRLLDGLGLSQERAEPDAMWTQGAIQLALGRHAERYLPEVIGFNLGYEQLPLHLLITAYELDELGIDPYYFTLHVTVDNAASGHARQACDAALEMLPKHGDAQAFWQRMREGSKLGCIGAGTTSVIESFDDEAEVVRIFTAKAPLGAGAHANHCRLGGKLVNDWLREPSGMAGFLHQLEAQGWIQRGAPVSESRFWNLLQGDRAQMFGVFSPYELQVIHDWIRGEASADGAPYHETPGEGTRRRPRFEVARRARGAAVRSEDTDLLDPDLDVLKSRWAAAADESTRRELLAQAMGPAEHWTPAGLWATRVFQEAGR